MSPADSPALGGSVSTVGAADGPAVAAPPPLGGRSAPAVSEVSAPVPVSSAPAVSGLSAPAAATPGSAQAVRAVVGSPAVAAAAASAPVMTAAAAPDAVSGISANLLSWLASGVGGTTPAAAPLAWTAAAFTRREFSGTTVAPAAAGTTTSGPGLPGGLLTPPKASAAGGFRLFGDGTADSPNAGLLGGNGFSYTSYAGACTTGACTGGRAGLLFGGGGGGYAGGAGGAAGLFGNGGAGGAGLSGVNGVRCLKFRGQWAQTKIWVY